MPMNVKRKTLLFAVAAFLAGAALARADHVGNVIGLVNLSNYQAALLVITDSPPERLICRGHAQVGDGRPGF